MGKNKKSTVNQNTNDLTVYKVGAAFVLLVLSLIALGRVLNVYATGSSFDVVYNASETVWKICAALCVVCIAAFIALRSKAIRKVFPYLFALSLLACLTALDLRYFWTEHATALYMLHAAVYGLYIIFCLYQSEFFCFSLAAVFAGFSFYFYSKGLGMNARTAIIDIVVALVLAAVALLANRAAKGKGSVKLFGKTRKLFPARFNATVLYVACTVLGCCLVACLLLGSALFAYYCMFAAIAIEFIGAVYYTFQLK